MVDLPPPEPSSLRSEQQTPAPLRSEKGVEQQEADNTIQPTTAEPAEDGESAETAEQAAAPVVNDLVEIDPKTGKKRRVNFDSIQIAEQVHQVQEWLTMGKRPNQIRRLCADQWGVTSRTAESRIQMARRQMVVDANVMDRTDKVGQMLQQLEQVLEQALQMKQGSNAIGALRLQADLLQLLTRQN